MESKINNLPNQRALGPEVTVEFYQILKEEILPVLYDLFQKIEAEGILLNSFYETSNTIMQKHYKEKKDYKPISLININAEILNKITANWIQQCIERILYNGQEGFTPGMQDWFNIWKSINVIHQQAKKEKSNHINRCKKNIWQNPTIIHDENSQQARTRGWLNKEHL